MPEDAKNHKDDKKEIAERKGKIPNTVGVLPRWRTIKFVQQIWGALIPELDHIVCHTLHLFGIRPGTPLGSAWCTRIWILYEAWHQHRTRHTCSCIHILAGVASSPWNLRLGPVQSVQQTKNHWLSSNSPPHGGRKSQSNRGSVRNWTGKSNIWIPTNL